ncbi:MAG TPA: prolyl oligopeptidase family serine peptidase [Bryobacteraceae bacterium]|nr:prolyl oligopeptidase family serine peptidase [Bryobacteraceae bacterium]
MRNPPYGSWKSPLTSDLIVAQSIGLSEVRIHSGESYWLESRPQEAGRSVVVRGGQDLNPAPFNARTRVHEYGGGAWTGAGGVLYFSNDSDRRLYRLDRGTPTPVPLTPPGKWRYADGIIDARRGLWIGVREDHTTEGSEPVNTIVGMNTGGAPQDAGRVLAAGHDFVSSPKLSPDGDWLAWLAWDHPRMPWVGTTLFAAPLDEEGIPCGEPVAIAGGPEESVFQPEWAPDGSLLFVSDRTGWWNLYGAEAAHWKTHPLAPMQAEFGQPQWVFGMSTYAPAAAGRLVCSYVSGGLGRLAILETASGKLQPIDTPYTDFSSVRAEGDTVVFRGGSDRAPASVVRLDLGTGKLEVLKKSTDLADRPELARYFTGVEQVEFPTTGNRKAFGLYYPAFNPDYEPPKDEKPPLLVKCHGGPTSAASSTLDLRIQYWTSRGIAVLDVNYGGSTGYGREYRQRLNGQWGIVDVDDCVNGACHLAESGVVDGHRSVITGGSAGGFTTLAALAFRDFFRGGASHFGVSDLAALARDTHKFESRYLDSLVGPFPEREDLYRERSPLHHAEGISVPVIFFQGDEDLVVPVEQTESMVAALRKKGKPTGYFLFAGEQHGFRRAENIKRSLDAELYFYAINVFGIALYF